ALGGSCARTVATALWPVYLLGVASRNRTRPAGSWLPRKIIFQRVSVTGARYGRSDDEGVVATFFLIRYQSVAASRSEINFACQFFRISLFILAVQQNFRNPLTETFRSEIALNSAPMTNGNRTGLLRNYYCHGIGFFSDPQTGPVT